MRRFGRIILYLLASVGAVVTFSILGLILTAVFYGEPEFELPDRIVLTLDLDRGVTDGRSDDPWRKLRGDDTLYLHEVLTALRAAARDERVAGLAIRLGGARISLAHAQELRGAVKALRAGGKFTMAFAETFGGLGNATTEYYLAAAVDEIWMQPTGLFAVLGIGVEMPFLREAFDKAGVKPEFEQRYEYKSFVELFTRNDMSEPARASLTRMIESWMTQIIDGIVGDRGLENGTLRALIDRAPLLAEEAREARLIDRLAYWETFAQETERRGGEGAVSMPAARYAAVRERDAEPAATVALIYGSGPIVSGGTDNGLFDSEQFAAGTVSGAIDDAAEDSAVKAILLRVDSPGGSYIGSDIVWRAVKRAREKGKPVIASMGKYAASGGYFVAMAADKVVALPATVTGSIGVFGGKFATAGLWEKFGVHWDRVSVGANAGMWSQIHPFSQSESDRHRAIIDFVYRDFIAKVKADRSLPDERIDAVARGRVWTGVDAHDVGLVDALGGYETAMGLVREALGLAPDAPLDFTVLPKPLSPLDRLRAALADGVPLTQALVQAVSGPRRDPLAVVGKFLEPVIGDASLLRPPAGLLQMPPFRVVR